MKKVVKKYRLKEEIKEEIELELITFFGVIAFGLIPVLLYIIVY